ncbi:MAG: RagB/SusD family nutrient uptake outer membrane protein [Ferruginibacter sp.]
MKYLITILVLATMLSSSCKKGFIDLPPVSTVSTEALYKTDKDYSDAIIGVYSILRDQYQSFWQFDLASDDSRHQWPSEDIWLRLDNYTYQTDEPFFLTSWGNYYGIIFRANTLLDKLAAADAAAVPNKDRYMAEAKFLRAFAYFDLVRLFGDVPLVTKVINDEEAIKIPRSKTDLVYNEVIIKDLLEAQKNLPATYTGDNAGRPTSGAAAAILGKVYLTKKDFVNAASKLLEVTTMGYELLPNYNDLFDYTKDEHHKEYIFDIEYETGIQQGSDFTNNFFPRDQDAQDFFQVYGGTGDTNTPSDSSFSLFSAGDARKDVSVARGFIGQGGVYHSLANSAGAKTMTKKYITPVAFAGDSKVNWKVIRYADVLLMLAEAINESGATADALPYLNMVRTRAKVAAFTGLTKDDAREKIYLERRLELSFEGLRWFDLVRTGRAYETLKYLGMKPYMVLFPIPLSQIQVVNDPAILSQNSGY